MRPSGDQASSGPRLPRQPPRPLPSAFMTQTSAESARSLTKAIFRPFGDQSESRRTRSRTARDLPVPGAASELPHAGPVRVHAVDLVCLRRARTPSRMKGGFRQSGDQIGKTPAPPGVRFSLPVPSAFMIQTSVEQDARRRRARRPRVTNAISARRRPHRGTSTPGTSEEKISHREGARRPRRPRAPQRARRSRRPSDAAARAGGPARPRSRRAGGACVRRAARPAGREPQGSNGHPSRLCCLLDDLHLRFFMSAGSVEFPQAAARA